MECQGLRAVLVSVWGLRSAATAAATAPTDPTRPVAAATTAQGTRSTGRPRSIFVIAILLSN